MSKNRNRNTSSNVNTEVAPATESVVLNEVQQEAVIEQVMTNTDEVKVDVDVSTEQQTETEEVKKDDEVDLRTLTAGDLIAHFGGISKTIRALNDLGWSRGEIAKAIGKKYQHVRNVLITPLTSKTTV